LCKLQSFPIGNSNATHKSFECKSTASHIKTKTPDKN